MTEKQLFSIPPLGKISLPDEAATARLAQKLSALCAPGDILALEGTLGVGKSVFARHFIQAQMGVEEDVPSPTFTLVQTYDGEDATLYHFDLYRLCQAEEAFELDIEDAFHDGISLIEWPARLGPYLPDKALWLNLVPVEGSETARTVSFYGPDDWIDRLQEGGIDV